MTIPRSLSVAAKLGRTSVAENTQINTPFSVGTINTYGASTATLYSLEGEHAEYFQLVRTGLATYEVALRSGVQLDYESLSQLNVTVRATSPLQPNNPGLTANFSLRITDAQDAPVIEGGDTATVQVAFGETAVHRVVATDQDGDQLTYKIVGGTDRSLFEIDAATGELSFKQAPPSTGRTSFNVIVEVADKGTPASSLPIWMGGKPGTPPLTDKQVITVELFQSNEHAPEVVRGPFNFTENSFTFEVFDQDGDDLTFYYRGVAQEVQRNEDGTYTMVVAPSTEESGLEWGDVTASDGVHSVKVTHVFKGNDNANDMTSNDVDAVVFGFGGLDFIDVNGLGTTVVVPDNAFEDRSIVISEGATATIDLFNTFEAGRSAPLVVQGFKAGSQGDTLVLGFNEEVSPLIYDVVSDGSGEVGTEGSDVTIDRYLTAQTLNLFDVSDGGSIETFLATRLSLMDLGEGARLYYLINDSSGDTGVYEAQVTLQSEDIGTEDIELEYIAVLVGVDINQLIASNLSWSTFDPVPV